MHIHEIDTPSILIDLDAMERNITRVQALCDAAGVKLRPHIKTHKIPAIAKMQLDAGAVGIACQKVSEAEVFAQAGCDDIMIPYNIIGEQKTARLTDLALYNRVTVSADSLQAVVGYAEAAKKAEITLRVMVELATEIERAGAGVDKAVELARRIEVDDHLHFAGVLVYPSNPTIRPLLTELLERLHAQGIGVDVVSGGGTGALLHLGEVPELTEIRVGTYVFNDWTTVSNGWCLPEDCAALIAATVVSRPTNDRLILDAGSKTLSSDTRGVGYGLIVEYPAARLYKLNEEHGYVDVSACETAPEIGERVHIIPEHVCVAVNLHNMIYGVRGDQVEVEWEVAARGLLH